MILKNNGDMAHVSAPDLTYDELNAAVKYWIGRYQRCSSEKHALEQDIKILQEENKRLSEQCGDPNKTCLGINENMSTQNAYVVGASQSV